jgi:hypothetical protein
MKRSHLATLSLGALAFVAAGCARQGIKVKTVETPGANITQYRTFRVLPPPARRADAPALPQSDPMLDNSITNQALRQDLQQAFVARGYSPATQSPDFLVAIYAGTKEKFNTTYWDPGPFYRYGYWGFRDRWAWPYYGWAPTERQVQEYTQGTVVIDVIDPATNQLVWRGQGTANVNNAPPQYIKEAAEAVDKVVSKFPAAGAKVAGSR